MRIRHLYAVVCLFFLFSCSGTPPSILNTEWMVVYTQDKALGAVFQELNFFVQLKDEDGDEDITEISLKREDFAWSWRIDPSNWVSYSKDGEYWVGANGLTLGNEGEISAGRYQLVAIDRSGQRDEKEIFIRKPDVVPDQLKFPSVRRSGNTLQISASVQPLVLWFYDNQAALVKEKYVKPGAYELGSLLNKDEKQRASWLYVYYQDERKGYGLKVGPFLLDGP